MQPPSIPLDGEFVLDAWRPEDAAAHRAFAEDADAARFFGWTVDEARAQPDSHYLAVVERFRSDWNAGSRLSLAVRGKGSGEAVGAVELRPKGDTAEVSYLVAPQLRGRSLAPRALDAFLGWATRELRVRRAVLSCHVENAASRRVAEKCGFTLVARSGDELRFERELGP